MRVLARPDDYYAGAYTDRDLYDCYALTDRVSDRLCYAYVEQRSDVGQELRELFGRKQQPKVKALHGPLQGTLESSIAVQPPKRVTLKLVAPSTRGKEKSLTLPQVEIASVAFNDWVQPGR